MAEPPQAPAAPPEPPREMRERSPLTTEGEILAAASRGKGLAPDEQDLALAWFLSDDADGDAATKTIEINVGNGNTPQWVPWTIRAVDMDTLRRIRRNAQGNRAARRAGEEIDEIQANLQIVVEGTVAPDLVGAARKRGIADPATALQLRFERKPGLLGQIAGEIMSLSGYDDEDVRDAAAARG